MTMERKYYLATPGGKSAEAVKTWQRMSAEAYDKVWAFCKSVGAEGKMLPTCWGARVGALYFSSDPGRDWRRIKHIDGKAYLPSKSTKVGKGLMKQLDAINIPNSDSFAKLIGGGGWVASGREMGWVSFQHLGGAIVISVPIPGESKDAFIPPDATLLKMSDYHALKEAADEAKEKNSTDGPATA